MKMEAMEELCLVFSSSDKKHHEDLRCEFDAPRYYDFSRPETCFEAQEAERWFDFAATYPPSPFVAKVKLGNYNGIHRSSNEKMLNDQEHVYVETDSRTESVASTSYKDGDTTKDSGKEKPHAVATTARSSSTLMKPTASYLAKQRQDINLNRLLLIRHPKSHTKDEKINSARSSISHIATKRQKLEAAGHKVAAAATNAIRHNKVTIPREPFLETSRRAQRRRSKDSTDESVTKSRFNSAACSKAPRHLSHKVGSHCHRSISLQATSRFLDRKRSIY